MPASIFSETELARLASFPEEIPGDDLIRAFTLTGADRDLVAIRRGAANRLGIALQLCALRYLGFVPRNLSAAPRSAACFVADQLKVSPDEIQSYARREQTSFTALHRGSGTPRLLDAPVTGLGRTRSLAGSNGPLSTMLRRFSFASHVSGCAPRGSSFQHPTESYDLSVRRAVAHRRERTPWSSPCCAPRGEPSSTVDPQVARAGCFWREPWDPSRARWPNWHFSASWEPMSGTSAI